MAATLSRGEMSLKQQLNGQIKRYILGNILSKTSFNLS